MENADTLYKKLLEELGMKAVQVSMERPLFSWHANLISINRRKTIVLVNDSNRYVIVLYGLKTKDFNNISEIILKAIVETLLDEGIKAEIVENWQHYIEVEKIIEDYPQNYPVCLAWEGNVPQEDVGGEGGYEEFLEAFNDPNHEEHENMVSWAKMQWYRDFDVDLANRRLKYMLKSRC